MGPQMPAVRFTLIFLSVVAIVACGTRRSDSGSALSAGSGDGDVRSDMAAPAEALLAECQVPYVIVVPTSLPPQSVSRTVAERAAGAYGASGAAAIAIPALVTVGIDIEYDSQGRMTGRAPTAGRLLVDADGNVIAARPAWALVFRGQSIPRPGFYGMLRRPPPVTTLAVIIDARAGRAIRGWGCAAGPA
jgi:hypothetical protein